MTDTTALQTERGPDGDRLYVAHDETEKGSKAPFFVAYRDEERARRWGFFCGNCETFSTAMDSMGRIRCNDCENFKRPDEWDAAHE